MSSLLWRLFSSCSKRGPRSGCHTWASQCSGFSCCGAQALEHTGFSSGGMRAQQLQFPGSRAQAHSCGPGLSCSVACGSFLDQGLNLCLLHWQPDSLPLSHQGSPSYHVFSFHGFIILSHWIYWLQYIWTFFSLALSLFPLFFFLNQLAFDSFFPAEATLKCPRVLY